jgi:hypothetical protein
MPLIAPLDSTAEITGIWGGAFALRSRCCRGAFQPAREERDAALHERAVVALLLYPDLGVEEPVAAVAGRYDLHRGALEAAARFAVPDRVVVPDVLAPAA